MLPSSYAISYDVDDAAITEITGFSNVYTQDYYQAQILLPKIYQNTVATATITPSTVAAGEVDATINAANLPSTHTFTNGIASPNNSLIIGGTSNANQRANIVTQITVDQDWLYAIAATTEGTARTPVARQNLIVEPYEITFNSGYGKYPWAINVATNTTGSNRTGTVVVEKFNTRVTGSLVCLLYTSDAADE